MFVFHVPEETKAYLQTPLKHPKLFLFLYLPAIVGFIVACRIYKFKIGFLLFPLLWCFLVGLYLIKGVVDGKITDNHGTAIRKTMPVRYWGKVAFWTFGYLCGIIFAIGFAVQERNKVRIEPAPAADAGIRASPNQ